MALTPKLSCLRFCLSVLSVLFALSSGHAATTPTQEANTGTTDTTPLLSFLDLASTQPLSITYSHNISYEPNPVKPVVKIHLSDWNLDPLTLNLFGGSLAITARGQIADARPTDINCTATLARINITRLLETLEVPRARELEAIISGMVRIEARGGDWKNIHVDLTAHDGTVRVSRMLLHQILSPAFGGSITAAEVDATLNKLFPGAKMIPLDGIHIEGDLAGAVLHMSIPLRNDVLNIDFDPNIDAALLWQVWQLLNEKALEGLRTADWDVNIERTQLAPTPKP